MSITANGTVRPRYVRRFVERQAYLLERLTADEFTAHCRFELFYCESGGAVADDDSELARVTHMRPTTWAKLRDKLIHLGQLQEVDGYLVDRDQDANIQLQRTNNDRGRKANKARWGNGGGHAA